MSELDKGDDCPVNADMSSDSEIVSSTTAHGDFNACSSETFLNSVHPLSNPFDFSTHGASLAIWSIRIRIRFKPDVRIERPL